MDFTNKPTNSTPKLTSEVAQTIYAKIIEHGNADLAFKAQTDSAYDPEHFKIVNEEADAMIRIINNHMSGSVVLKPAEYDEEGNVTKEAVYWKPTTESNLIALFDGYLLDGYTVVNDVENGMTWADFKASFKIGE